MVILFSSYIYFGGSRWNHFKNDIFVVLLRTHCNVFLVLVYRLLILLNFILISQTLLND